MNKELKKIYKEYSDLPNDIIREIVQFKQQKKDEKSTNYIYIKNQIKYLNESIIKMEHLLKGELYIKDLMNGYSTIAHPYDINAMIENLEYFKSRRREISNIIVRIKFNKGLGGK